MLNALLLNYKHFPLNISRINLVKWFLSSCGIFINFGQILPKSQEELLLRKSLLYWTANVSDKVIKKERDLLVVK